MRVSLCFTTLLGFVIALPSIAAATNDDPADLTVWPNRVSHANSDPWLVANHDKLTKMRPRVLVINFANGFSPEQARQKVTRLAAALTEGTRYHGYKDPKAPAFIEWQIHKIVDLSDPKPYPKTPDGNSTKYPRTAHKGLPNFSYKELYSETFAQYFGFRDPQNKTRYLKLNELVERGIVHELWMFAYERGAGSPFECTELKPVYDENFKRVGDKHRHAGNGGDPEEPWHGRSLRITYINAERDIGCTVESQSHSMEHIATAGVIPYYRKYFYEYAGHDLDKRFGLPWISFYPLGGEGKGISYPNDHTAIITDGEKTYRIDNYCCIGGNVHFTPNGRFHYDRESPVAVLSTIEHYRLFDGPDGKDLAEPWTIDAFQQYKKIAPDCMGAWLIYWRQNMPGYQNNCKDDDGKPMKNWWPFLYY